MRSLVVVPTEHAIRPYVQMGLGVIGQSTEQSAIYDMPIGGSDINGWTRTGGVGFLEFLNDHYAVRMGFDFTQDIWKVN